MLKYGAFILSACVSVSSFGKNTSWIGGNGNWSVAANWSNGIPSTDDVATVSNGNVVTIDGNENVGSLVIEDNSIVQIVSAEGTSLTADDIIVGVTSTDESAFFESDGTVVASVIQVYPAAAFIMGGTSICDVSTFKGIGSTGGTLEIGAGTLNDGTFTGNPNVILTGGLVHTGDSESEFNSTVNFRYIGGTIDYDYD